MIESFAEFIDPVCEDQFLSEIWERRVKIWHSDASATFRRHLEFMSVVCEAMRRGAISPIGLRVVRDGIEIAKSRYAVGEQSVDWVAVFREYCHGATVVLESIERWHDEVQDIVASMWSVFHAPVSVNLYLTPQNSTGFRPHADATDVFVYQLQGSKEWRLYESLVQLPTPEQTRKIVNIGPPSETHLLRASDRLYLPRGTVHAASSLDEASVHLSFAVNTVTVFDLLKELLRLLVFRQQELRVSIPMIPADEVVRCVQSVLPSVSHSDILHAIDATCFGRQSPPSLPADVVELIVSKGMT